jgi:transposase
VARTMQDDTTKPPVAFDHEATIIAVVELSRNVWMVAGRVPGLARRPVKKTAERAAGLLRILRNWQAEAERTGRQLERVIVAFEAGRDGFWLARLLRRQGIESYVIHPVSIPVPRGVRAKTDRLDTDMLLRALSAWLRGEPDACRMAAIPSLEEEDLRRPSRERAALTTEKTRLINRIRALLTLHGLVTTSPTPATHKKLDQLRTAEGEALPANTRAELGRLFERLALVKQQLKAIEIEVTRTGPVDGEAPLTTHALAMVGQLATVVGMGTNTAMVLVTEVFIREFPDRRALARFVGLTGTPDESGSRRRDRGLIKAGSSRVRHVMIQLAWRLLYHQPDCTLVHWYRGRVEQANGAGKKTFIVALARKLLIALWRFVRDGEVPDGMRLAAASPAP